LFQDIQMNIHVYERLYHWLYASEGLVPHMYLDSLSLVTVGIGFMMEHHRGVLDTEWENRFVFSKGVENHSSDPQFPDGPRFPGRRPGEQASPADVRKEFSDIKKLTNLKGHWTLFTPFAELQLAPNVDVKATVKSKLKEKEDAVKSKDWEVFYRNFDSFPPDAQMGILSTAYGSWANTSPQQNAFHSACQAQDWHAAAESGYWNGWLKEKRNGHKLMFENAQAAKDSNDKSDQPAFPGRLSTDGDYEIDDQIRPYGQNIWKAGG
jgi:hypothetical protein